MRILTELDVRAAVSHEAALEVARRTLKAQARGQAILSSPSAMMLDASSLGGPRAKFKAASLADPPVSGIRLLSHPSPTNGAYNYCAIYDHSDGKLAGLVGEQWLSCVRTAAFGVASVERLVNEGPLVVALFGAGRIAAEMIPLLGRALNIVELRVNSARAESMAAFTRLNQPLASYPIRPVPQAREAVAGADLVVTLTESKNPVVLPGTLKPGAVVCSMGSYNEIDYAVLAECAHLVVDDPDFASEMGDGGAWISQGKISRQTFLGRIGALACEVAASMKSVRQSPSDRILALVQGMAIGDVALAAYALEQARSRGLGITVDLP